MKVKIMIPKAGTANAEGTATRLYEKDEVVETSEGWQDELMTTFLDNGWAMEIKVVEPKEVAKTEEVTKSEPPPKPKAKKKAKAKAKAKAKSKT
tara:strand:+ start:112 stop:393 length:282 start_codon:yes stop_codon:yes gene_type:complete